MPALTEILKVVETIAPPELAQDWDNVGLLVNCGGDVRKALVTLDITPAVVAEAAENDCQLVVAHHPVIFQPLKELTAGSPAFALVRAGVSAICAHTNLDAAEGGVNDVLAELFGLAKVAPFDAVGRVGTLPAPLAPGAFAGQVAERLGCVPVQFVDGGRPVRRLALCGGSGSHLVTEAVAAGADALLTGEAGHHDALEAADAGLSLFVAGHYHTEWPVVPVLARRLREAVPQVEWLVAQSNRDPYCYCSF